MAGDARLRQFVRACHRVAALGLVRCSSGNMSWRVSKDRVLASASRAWLGTMTKSQVSICRLSDGGLLDGPKPTVELASHLAILRARPALNVVLHYQSPFATTMSCMDFQGVNFFLIPEIPYYVGPIGEVPYLDPGSEALAEAVVAVMKDHNLALMRNHGQITVGKTFDEAIQNACFFELACESILRSGGKARPMPHEGVQHLLSAGRAV